MEALSATKTGEPDSSSPRRWRQRKQENARRRQEIERRKQLVDGYVQALGGSDRVSAITMADVESTVDLMLLARKARADLLKGVGSIDKTVKVENAAGRALKRLNLPAPGAAAAPSHEWQNFLASQHAAPEGDG